MSLALRYRQLWFMYTMLFSLFNLQGLKGLPSREWETIEQYNENVLTLTFPGGKFYLLEYFTEYGYKVENKKEYANIYNL